MTKRLVFFAVLFLFISLCKGSGWTVPVDEKFYLWAQSLSYSTWWLRLWEAVTALGAGYFVYPLVAVPAVVLLAKNKNRETLIFIIVMVALFNLNPLLKLLFALPRPVSLSPYTDLATHTFPSGHAVNGVLLFYFLPRFAARVFGETEILRFKSPLFFIPGLSLVALSRVMLGVHWFSDVLGGVCLGFVMTDILMLMVPISRTLALRRPPSTVYRLPYSAIIFDLDGTLIDSKRDIVTATNATLKAMGAKPLPADVVAAHVGQGVRDLIRGTLSAAGVRGPETEDETIAHFFKFYMAHCLDTTCLFDGVPELLESLKNHGVKMAIFTNKPQIYTDRILDGLGVTPYFQCVLGSDNGYPNKPDPTGTAMILKTFGVSARETLMVGDSDVDLMTAQNMDMDCALYLKGFSTRAQILSLAKQTKLVFDDFADLHSFAINCAAT